MVVVSGPSRDDLAYRNTSINPCRFLNEFASCRGLCESTSRIENSAIATRGRHISLDKETCSLSALLLFTLAVHQLA
jgi:hypothetical protein